MCARLHRNLLLISVAIALGLAGCNAVNSLEPGEVPEDALFADDFSGEQSGAWQLERDSLGTSSIVDGALNIEVNAPNTIQFSTLSEPAPTDFDLSVDAAIASGDPRSTYGVLFRMQSAEAFYRFELTGDGRYMIERRDPDGRWTRFVDDWTPSEAISTGLNVTNRVRVNAEGDSFRVYVNGELLQQFRDPAYASGNVALDAGTFGQPGLRVRFDNLILLDN